MLGNTITLTDGAGSPTTITVTKINQDQYGGEYLFRSSTSAWRLKVRHSVVKATATRSAYDRHNVEIVQTIFAVGDTPEFQRKTYLVMENLPADGDLLAPKFLSNFMSGSSWANLTSLQNWES